LFKPQVKLQQEAVTGSHHFMFVEETGFNRVEIERTVYLRGGTNNVIVVSVVVVERYHFTGRAIGLVHKEHRDALAFAYSDIFVGELEARLFTIP
jgi:hypothetical protein